MFMTCPMIPSASAISIASRNSRNGISSGWVCSPAAWRSRCTFPLAIQLKKLVVDIPTDLHESSM